MSDETRWHGDELPAGLTPEDRIAWPVAATVVIRFVPDPETGRRRGLSMEYSGELPKLVLAHRLMSLVQDFMTHEDFQEGVPLIATDANGQPEEGQ